MKKSLRVDAEAEEEIAHAIDRYENEREGLGVEFWRELSEGDGCTAIDGQPTGAGASEA